MWSVLLQATVEPTQTGFFLSGALLASFFLLLGALAVLAFFGFWLWTLVKAITLKQDNQLLWALVIIFLGVLGSLLYYFFALRKAPGYTGMPRLLKYLLIAGTVSAVLFVVLFFLALFVNVTTSVTVQGGPPVVASPPSPR